MKPATWFSILGVLLAMTTLTADTYMLPKLLAFSVGVAAMWSSREWRERKILAMDAALLALLGCVYLSSALSTDWRLNVFGQYRAGYTSCFGLTLCMLGYFAAKDADEEDVCNALVTGAVLLSIYAILQQGGYDFVTVALPSHRSISTIGGPPFLGCVLAACLPFAVARRIPIILAPILGAIVLTGSRAALLGAGAALAVLWFKPKSLKWLTFLAVAAAACFLIRGHHDGDSMRIDTWMAALKIFRGHPWFGVGPEGFLDAFRSVRPDSWLRTTQSYLAMQDNAHNDLLHALATTGIFGFCAYLWLGLETARQLWRTQKRTALASVVAVAVYAKFDPVPFAALAILAMVVGAATGSPKPAESRAERAEVWFTGFGLSALCVITAFHMLAADMAFTEASRLFTSGSLEAATYMRTALESVPAEPVYTVEAIESLWAMWRAGRKNALQETVLLAYDMTRKHPGNIQGHEIYAMALAMLAVHSYPQGAPAGQSRFAYTAARGEISKVLAMDRDSLKTREIQAHLGYHFRDLAYFQEGISGIARVMALTRTKEAEGMICKLCERPWKDHR